LTPKKSDVDTYRAIAALNAQGVRLLNRYNKAYSVSEVSQLPAYLQPRVRWPYDTMQIGDVIAGQVFSEQKLPEQAYLVVEWEYPPLGSVHWPPGTQRPSWAKVVIPVWLVPVPAMSRLIIGHKQIDRLPGSTTPQPQVWASCSATQWRHLWQRGRQPRLARIEDPVFRLIHTGRGKHTRIDLCARVDADDIVHVASLERDVLRPWVDNWLQYGPRYRLYVAPGWHLYPRGEALSILVDGYYHVRAD